MRNLVLNLILFVGIFIVLVFFDYYRDSTFQWIENLIHTLFFVFIFGLLSWLTNSKKTEK